MSPYFILNSRTLASILSYLSKTKIINQYLNIIYLLVTHFWLFLIHAEERNLKINILTWLALKTNNIAKGKIKCIVFTTGYNQNIKWWYPYFIDSLIRHSNAWCMIRNLRNISVITFFMILIILSCSYVIYEPKGWFVKTTSRKCQSNRLLFKIM